MGRSLLRGRSDGRARPGEAQPFTRIVSAVDEVHDDFGNAGNGDRACNSKWRSLYEGLMHMSMNTRSSGSDRLNDIQSNAHGGILGRIKLVNVTKDSESSPLSIRFPEKQAPQDGLEQKAKEFAGKARKFTARLEQFAC
jgi:hypothetical protein